MGDSVVAITAGSGTNISTRTNASSEHMQVLVLGVDGSDSVVPSSATSGVTVDGYRPATATLANVSASASSVTLIASNSSRKGAVIVNDSTVNCYVKFGSTASTTSYTYKLLPSDSIELPQPCYTGIITGISDSATGTLRTTELT